MSKEFEILNNNDVISVLKHNKNRFVLGNTLKIQQLLEEYQTYISESNSCRSNTKIFDDSIECEVLRHDGDRPGWRKGKIRFVVQFEPEETENDCSSNSLDDIRQQLNSQH